MSQPIRLTLHFYQRWGPDDEVLPAEKAWLADHSVDLGHPVQYRYLRSDKNREGQPFWDEWQPLNVNIGDLVSFEERPADVIAAQVRYHDHSKPA